MAWRQVRFGREPVAGRAKARAQLRLIAAAALLATAVACAASHSGVAAAARLLAGLISPSASAQAVPPPSAPSKEYIYGGGRLVATEEPTPAPVNGAAFVSQVVPSSMTAGRPYSASVVMRNTGTTTWTQAAGYRLGSQNPRDNGTWRSPRVDMPATVAPGAEATFTFTITAPSEPGTYNFQWAMVQDGVEWFGPHTANVIVTVSAPTGGALDLFPAEPGLSVNLTAEGTSDWAHWGLGSASGFDRKAGAAPQISNFTLLGSGAPSALGDLAYSHTWTDGVPTQAATTTTGVHVGGAAGNGFQITVPADTATKTLKLYVGAWYARAQLRARLSDSSAPDAVGSLVADAGTLNRVYTISYKAASAGQTLTVSYTLEASYNSPHGNVTLQAATLADGAPPPLPANGSAFVRQSVPDWMTAGRPYSVSVTMRNTGANTWTQAGNYRLGSQNPQDNGTWGSPRAALPAATISGAEATFTFTVTAPATPGTYDFQWRVVQDGVEWFGDYSANVPVTVLAAQSGGALAGGVAAQTANVNLTSEGTRDWAHWGLYDASSFNHKAGVASQISNYSVLGAGAVSRLGDLAYSHSWGDGTPAPAASTNTGVFVSGTAGNGFQIVAPAGTTTRTLKLYVGAWYARGRLEARLGDGSAADYTDLSVDANGGTSNHVYTISYRAASDGQALYVSYTLAASYNGAYGNVTLQAATLATGAGVPAAPTGVVATALTPTSVEVTWAAPQGSVGGYAVERAQSAGAFTHLTNVTATSFIDGSASPETAYIYRVRAVSAGGEHSDYSNSDLATTVVFSEALTPRVTTIRAAHLVELRRAVVAVRALVPNLVPPVWTYPDPVSSPPEQRRRIYLEDVTELRANLDAALSALGRYEPYPAEPPLARGAPVAAEHFEQIRRRVR
ncbi:MAG TPA: NBR1-Ig-like domain-containing protein [Pyrinomonadaceae bacterium]|nr:NBR1-Ig-like domain-containing protein [Pyrinomonadaceae bacterium]